MKKILLFLGLIIVVSCTQNIIVEYEKPVLKKITEPNPLWLYELPEGSDYVVGISVYTADSIAMKIAAKEMAAVMKSRNTGSYTIEKYSQADHENKLNSGHATFKLNVGTPEETKEIYSKLKIIDSFKLYDNYIALYATESKGIEEKYKNRVLRSFPKWYRKSELSDKSNYITAWAEGHSHDLATAWEKAAEEARYQIAGYLEKDVLGAVENNNENTSKKVSVETTIKLSNLEIVRSYIVTEQNGSLFSYNVYLEMKMRKRI